MPTMAKMIAMIFFIFITRLLGNRLIEASRSREATRHSRATRRSSIQTNFLSRSKGIGRL